MDLPGESIKKLFANKVRLGLNVDSYLKRWPSLREPVKEESLPDKLVVKKVVKKSKR